MPLDPTISIIEGPMKTEFLLSTRRSFLSTSALALGTLAVSNSSAGFAQLTEKEAEVAANIPTADTRLKFNPDGTRRPFKGNTVICHLQSQGSTRDAVEQIATDLKRSSFIRKIALLPPDSYHMTVYPGVNDQGRDITGWPSDISKDASIEECSRIVGERMRSFHLECQLPLRMKVDETKTIENPRASTLRMIGIDEGEERKIRRIRDRLVDVFRFRDNKHDEYGFHITLAYQLRRFTPSEQAEYRSILAKNVPQIIASAPAFEFANPEFCSFPDMFRFDVRLLLAT
jgi:hypothetical protein